MFKSMMKKGRENIKKFKIERSEKKSTISEMKNVLYEIRSR